MNGSEPCAMAIPIWRCWESGVASKASHDGTPVRKAGNKLGSLSASDLVYGVFAQCVQCLINKCLLKLIGCSHICQIIVASIILSRLLIYLFIFIIIHMTQSN